MPSGIRVDGDHDLLVRMVEHLLDNAAKFTDGRRPVQLDVDALEAGCRLTVMDHGCGVEQDDPDVVAPFVRGRIAEDRALPGVGLGLAVVDSIARLHGATFSLTSDDAGTRAVVTW